MTRRGERTRGIYAPESTCQMSGSGFRRLAFFRNFPERPEVRECEIGPALSRGVPSVAVATMATTFSGAGNRRIDRAAGRSCRRSHHEERMRRALDRALVDAAADTVSGDDGHGAGAPVRDDADMAASAGHRDDCADRGSGDGRRSWRRSAPRGIRSRCGRACAR